ncbi:hypothetical protein ACFYQ5_35840 [Streptomyces sp. NPDC005794]|uniref:hypothetical protein n=1 Tax=Streptomyces sp. NPDC005794 TaxID=3364733 RepID=UPI0036962BEA
MEELQAESAELTVQLEKAREELSRLEITRETVTKVLAELSAAGSDVEADVPAEPESQPHAVGAVMIPPWREAGDIGAAGRVSGHHGGRRGRTGPVAGQAGFVHLQSDLWGEGLHEFRFWSTFRGGLTEWDVSSVW